MYSVLLLGGRFDAAGGRQSDYINKLHKALVSAVPTNNYRFKTQNGGTFANLVDTVDRLSRYDAVLWFADVPNELPKLVNNIQHQHPGVALILCDIPPPPKDGGGMSPTCRQTSGKTKQVLGLV